MKTLKRLEGIARGIDMSKQEMMDVFNSIEPGETVAIGDKEIKKILQKKKMILRIMQNGKIISSVVIR